MARRGPRHRVSSAQIARELAEFRDDADRNLFPKVRDSGLFLTITPSDGKPDAKFCLELGYALMLDKPIITLKRPDQTIPGKLFLVSDKIVEVDIRDTDEAALAIQAAIEEWTKAHPSTE